MNVVSVHCGHNFTMAITDKGVVYALGNNTYGQLGNNGSPGKSAVPVRVVVPDNLHVSLISCAHFHCLMVAGEEPRETSAKYGDVRSVAGVGGEGKSATVGDENGMVDGKRHYGNKSGLLDELGLADVRLRAVLERYNERKRKGNASTAEQSRELVIADILRLSSAPAVASGSSPSSSVSS